MSDYIKAVATPPGEPTQYMAMTADEIAARQTEEALPSPSPSPLDLITAAVKQLDVSKRTDPDFGRFLSQCLTALNSPDGQPDMEAVGHLIKIALSDTPATGYYQTQDTDFRGIITQAKTLFGV